MAEQSKHREISNALLNEIAAGKYALDRLHDLGAFFLELCGKIDVTDAPAAGVSVHGRTS